LRRQSGAPCLRTGADFGELLRNCLAGVCRQIGKTVAKVGEGLLSRPAVASGRHFAGTSA
jgi:hypothetical protein